jgi:hypothetical protein
VGSVELNLIGMALHSIATGREYEAYYILLVITL